ncbi:MAG: tRNA (guanosine(37)-N1)-methyltransferase TrmD [Mycoplasmoidaceae bacterium]
MKITILTLFPNIINEYINSSIIKKAVDKKICEINIVNFRDFSKEKHLRVDDYQFGGGPGMVLMLQPIVDAINFYKKEDTKVILLTPSGKTLNTTSINDLSKLNDIILICGHYEGFDERIIHYIDEEISIGDYVLTGGELPALVVLDSIIRRIPNAINEASLIDESFNNNLLDYPVYTKPLSFEDYQVPDVLLSGNHQAINEFREKARIEKTIIKRKDLYEKYLNNKKGK